MKKNHLVKFSKLESWEELKTGTKIEVPCKKELIFDGIELVCDGKLVNNCTNEYKKICSIYDSFAGLP